MRVLTHMLLLCVPSHTLNQPALSLTDSNLCRLESHPEVCYSFRLECADIIFDQNVDTSFV